MSAPSYFDILKYISHKSVQNIKVVFLFFLFLSHSQEEFTVYDISTLMYNIILFDFQYHLCIMVAVSGVSNGLDDQLLCDRSRPPQRYSVMLWMQFLDFYRTIVMEGGGLQSRGRLERLNQSVSCTAAVSIESAPVRGYDLVSSLIYCICLFLPLFFIPAFASPILPSMLFLHVDTRAACRAAHRELFACELKPIYAKHPHHLSPIPSPFQSLSPPPHPPTFRPSSQSAGGIVNFIFSCRNHFVFVAADEISCNTSSGKINKYKWIPNHPHFLYAPMRERAYTPFFNAPWQWVLLLPGCLLISAPFD